MAAALSCLASCATTGSLAPQPEAQASPQISEGRGIYITCAGSCHAPEPVLKYPRHEWLTKHIPEMAPEAKLTPAQTAALEAYIKAVCPI